MSAMSLSAAGLVCVELIHKQNLVTVLDLLYYIVESEDGHCYYSEPGPAEI